ncbi:MAG: lipopolysaccharide heptosyltransferase I [Candidatus Desulfacyla sp.]
MNILIVKLSAIGDVVHTLHVLEALRKRFPGARIDWVVEEDSSQVLFGHPALNRVIVLRRKAWQKSLFNRTHGRSILREVFAFVDELRRYPYDLVIDLQGLLKSGVVVGLSRGKRKIGMGGSREGARLFLNEGPIPVGYDQHAIDRYLRVAESIGCEDAGSGGRIPYAESDKVSVDEILDRHEIKNGPFVAINPMAKWPTKLWVAERFAVLARRMREELGFEIVFTGSMSDRPVIEDMAREMASPPLNLAGRINLKELAYLYTRCRLMVSTDTGPMHVAAAMGCPVVALFGPTAPWRTGPYGKGHVVVRADVGCSPCFKKRCAHMTCMKEIGVDQVLRAAQEVMLHS